MKYFIIMATLLSVLSTQALDLKLEVGMAYDQGEKIEEYSSFYGSAVGDVGVYLTHDLNPYIELGCGLHHSSNPEAPDGRSLAVNGARCFLSATLYKF